MSKEETFTCDGCGKEAPLDDYASDSDGVSLCPDCVKACEGESGLPDCDTA